MDPNTPMTTLLLMQSERYKVVQAKAGDWDAVAAQASQQADTDQAARDKAAAGA